MNEKECMCVCERDRERERESERERERKKAETFKEKAIPICVKEGTIVSIKSL